MELEIHILGPVEATVDGAPAALGGPKQRALLALLALDPGTVVPADRLIEELWPEFDPGARSRLQVYVSQLRKALGTGGGAIEWRSEGYRLDLGSEAVDAGRFERLATAGADALRSSDPEAAARLCREALGLWRGAALADCGYGPLTQPAVSRLEELRLGALEDRIDADLALGHAQELTAELEALAAQHPLRERLRGQQMLALYRTGRQTDALEVFAAARRELLEALGLDPGAELRRLQEAILRQDPGLEVEPRELRARRHLPAPATALVGRQAALADIVERLHDPGVRLLTLTGAGGVGKTRLAIHAAYALADRFEHGVYFAELGPVVDAALVPQAVARALGVEERSDESLPLTLADHLRDRALLLVLDNLEHLTSAAAMVTELLAAAPALKVLATSRARLRLYGEHEYAVPPLEVPPPSPQPLSLEVALESDAVELFAVRAAAVDPAFRLTEDNVGAIARLCAALDGLPLAIELAAARVRTHDPEAMAGSLPGRLALAGEGPRDVAPRQRTLRATIDWSYELLAPPARGLFARLAVFTGGFTVEAAAEVVETGPAEVEELIEQSLLARRTASGGARRLEMLETVREFAAERLAESADADGLHERHARYFLALAEAAEPSLSGPGGRGLLATLEDEHANLRAALTWARASGAVEVELRLVASLARFWELAGHLEEGAAELEASLPKRGGASPAIGGRMLLGAASVALRHGDYGRMRSSAGESLELFEGLGDRGGAAQALRLLATAASNEGDLERGAALYERSRAIYRELGDELGLAMTISDLGCLALMAGEPGRAIALSEEALVLFSAAGERYGLLSPLFNLALANLGAGHHDVALERFAEGLELGLELGYREQIYYSLVGIAATASASGDQLRAATLLGAAEIAGTATGSTLEPLERELHDRAMAACSAALGEQGFAEAVAAGRALPEAEAVALALEFTAR